MAVNKIKRTRKIYTDAHKNDKIGTIKIISGIRKSSSSYGNYAVFVKELFTDHTGNKRWVEQPKAFYTKVIAEAYIKNTHDGC